MKLFFFPEFSPHLFLLLVRLQQKKVCAILRVGSKATGQKRPHSFSGLILKKINLRSLNPIIASGSLETCFVIYAKSNVSDSFQRCIKLIFFVITLLVFTPLLVSVLRVEDLGLLIFTGLISWFGAFFYVAVSKLMQSTGNLGDLCTENFSPELNTPFSFFFFFNSILWVIH